MKNNSILADLISVQYEPTRVQSLMIKALEESVGTPININDPGIPAVKLLEMSTMLSTAAILNDEMLDRKAYPYMALTEEDLYGHMTDVDYINMFASPGVCDFKFYFSRSEIISRSVQVGTSSIRKLTIPKHTRITANGIPFTMQYPVDFLVKPNGTIEVFYDLNQQSPLQLMSSNTVEWRSINVPNVNDTGGIMELVELTLSVPQMLQTTYYNTISQATVLKKKIELKNRYFATRAYIKSSSGNWTPMHITHSEQSFDVMTPTLLLKVVGNELIYELPYVYLMGNLPGREIRVDVYVTEGALNMDLSGLSSRQFSVEFLDLDADHGGQYTAPVTALETFEIRSTDIVSGGHDGMSFSDRRDRVLNNLLGPSSLPVTNRKMIGELELLGFEGVKAIDDITRRTFVAARTYPAGGSDMYNGIDAGTMTYRTTLDEMSKYHLSRDNLYAITLLPDALYRVTGDGLRLIDSDEMDALYQMDSETLVSTLNNRNYLWSPFHYVFDILDDRFDTNAFLMTDPKVPMTSYLGSNETTGLTASASSIRSIKYNSEGYTLKIATQSSKDFKEIADRHLGVQLAFIPEGESSLAYLNGQYLGRNDANEPIFQFDIPTRWDLSANSTMDIQGFAMKSGSTYGMRAPLSSKFQLIWLVAAEAMSEVIANTLDVVVGEHLLTDHYVAVYHEEIEMVLGQHVSHLWTGSRMVIGDRPMARYKEDVILTYGSSDESRFKIDPITGKPEVQVVDGRKQLIVLHEAGDPVLDELTGEPIVLYPKDSIIIGPDGPEYEGLRSTHWWSDITLFSAKYRFATERTTREYVNYIGRLTVDWSMLLGTQMFDQMLERTAVYFSPKNNLSSVSVLVDDMERTTINPQQHLFVDLYVDKSLYSSHDIRLVLENTIKSTINTEISKEVVSVSKMEEVLSAILPESVITVRISGLGGSSNYTTVTVQDQSGSLSIGKESFVDSDGAIGIRDRIQVTFKLHGVR